MAAPQLRELLSYFCQLLLEFPATFLRILVVTLQTLVFVLVGGTLSL